MIIEIHLPDQTVIQREFSNPVLARNLAKEYQKQCPNPILTCRINHQDRSLHTLIGESCILELCDLRTPSANMSYQTSLTFLYNKAVHDVLGKDVKVAIWNSLNKGLYTTIRPGNFTAEDVKKVEARMKELVDMDITFIQRTIKREEIERIAEQKGTQKMFRNSPDVNEAEYCSILDESEILFYHLLPSTGYLQAFELRKYHNGILLRFPHPLLSPEKVLPYEDQKMLYEAFSEAARWGRLMGINYASDLNEKMLTGDYKDLILLSEALHEKKIAEIARMIHDSGKRMVLIAGPSSSGKTTFAKRLIIQLRVLGNNPLYMGTDDYFKERSETPVLENGKKDYESLRAMDTDLLAKNMNELLEGKEADLPVYDFIAGEKKFGTRLTMIDHTQPIILEGIHALNPALTGGIPDEEKFKIYISPLTQVNIDPYNRIPTTDTRLLRRMVRDFQVRGYSANETIRNWPEVRAGEEKYIFPFNGEADVFFNSHALYELAVLKKYAEPLLRKITPEENEYAEAVRLLDFLEFFVAMPDDSIIPNNSIMREFIGGSVIVH
ncbi:MAG: hypothetical protein IIY44_02155 [Erysipelotrichales bacterium]|nr:hypothetical protein [Erysipelotrichales bacterium]